MTDRETSGDRRPQHVALLGALLQIASLGVLIALGISFKSDAALTVARFVAMGIPVWIVVYLVFRQMYRVALESLETEELRRARAAGVTTTIFEVDDEGLLLEQNRLQWLIRWMLPAATVVVAAMLLGGHFVWWRWTFASAFAADGFRRTTEATMCMWFVVAVGFGNFLYAWYVLALSKLPGWRLLHGGAVCLAANALACLLFAASLMLSTSLTWAEPLVAYIVRAALLVIGAELAFNFALDFYRPRVRGEIPRPSFDSRLLGLVSEPGGIAKSLAEAVNYQFGFEVSSTWFYKLLQRWLFPLMVFTAAIVLLLTSIVVVDAGEEAVVERWGRPIADGRNVLTPGLHFKYPFPIDVVYRAPARRSLEVVLGEATQGDDEDQRKAILWTESHEYVPELMVLVAGPKTESGTTSAPTDQAPSTMASEGTESVPVSLLMLSVPIHYRITDTSKYLYKYADPLKLLESVAYQYLCDYAAGVDIDAFMGPGRERINSELRDLLQARVSQLDMGIEIVFVGIRGAHPPSKDQVAATFQRVISAQTNMAATIHAAEGEARKILITVAGTEAQASQLDDAVKKRDRLRADPSTPVDDSRTADQEVTDLLLGDPRKGISPIGGRAAAVMADARAEAQKLVSDAAFKARRFEADVAAFEVAPQLYRQRKLLELYENIDLIRKFLIVGNPQNVTIIYETREEAGLDRVLSEGLEADQKSRTNR